MSKVQMSQTKHFRSLCPLETLLTETGAKRCKADSCPFRFQGPSAGVIRFTSRRDPQFFLNLEAKLSRLATLEVAEPCFRMIG